MTNINFTDQGTGTPVILIHGYCESNVLWSDLSHHLSPSFRILCPDLPGFGKSDLPEKPEFNLEDIAGIIKEWIDDLDIEKCVMIGHSLGGYVTLAFADKYPEYLLGFGLFHSTCFEDPPDKIEARNKVSSFIKEHGATRFTDALIPGLFYFKTDEIRKNIDFLVEDARSCSGESIIAYALAMRDRPNRCHLMNDFVPTLFIAGEKDGAVPIQTSREQITALDKRFVHILPDTGHMGMYERKSETQKMVSDFLEQFKES